MHIVAKVSDVAYGPLVILKLMLYRCLRMSNKFLLQAGFIYLLFFSSGVSYVARTYGKSK